MSLKIIDTWVRDATVPAVAAAVVRASGPVEVRVAGEASERSLFALASLTKPLVAAAVMVAVEEGAIDLDAPVGEHLPAYRTRSRAAITARHLLSHASGLPESAPGRSDPLEVEPVAPPETRRIYSNEGYAVLGLLLTAATRIAYSDYVREAVLEPLGMDAQLGLLDTDAARALEVREPGLWRPGVALFNSREWRRRATAAGGGFATVEAYARFVAMLLARGAPLIAEETFDEFSAVQFPQLGGGIESFLTWERAEWTLGCDLRAAKRPHWTGDRCSPATLSHFGAAGTLFFADPAAAVGLVCLANRGTYSGWAMRPDRWPDLCNRVIEAVPP
ncbi:MAG TPA: serine hydrolase domain-containing protein [Gaiellales bacterium]|nr:serine hydrolase domain-containing protein [Gaiellales bacterium]